MVSQDHLRKTLEYYRQQRALKLEELRSVEIMIRQLERELGETPSVESDVSQALGIAALESASSLRAVHVEPDEFFGMSQSDAAKRYLKKVGKAISLEQLVKALNEGGAQVGGVNPERTLYVSLARNPLKEFVSPRQGYIGLREFYKGLPKTGNGNKKSRAAKSGRKRRRPSKRLRKTNTEAPEKQAKSPVSTRVHQFLSDGQARSTEEIVRDVEAHLNRPVKKIEVLGALRSKGFVKENGKYQVAG